MHSNESANLAEFGVKDRWLRLKSYDKDLQVSWEPRSIVDSVLTSDQAAPHLFLSVPKNFARREIISRCCRDLLMALLRTVDRDLIMSIEPI